MSKARRRGLALQAQRLDLEEQPLPAGPWDLIINLDYLWRPLFKAYPSRLRPGGLLVFAQPTVQNLERHAHPSARFLLECGELATLVQDLEILHCDEAWRADGRHVARLVARR